MTAAPRPSPARPTPIATPWPTAKSLARGVVAQEAPTRSVATAVRAKPGQPKVAPRGVGRAQTAPLTSLISETCRLYILARLRSLERVRRATPRRRAPTLLSERGAR